MKIDLVLLRGRAEQQIEFYRELLSALDDNDRTNAGIMHAWGIIANVSGGDWTKQDSGWQAAAASFRDTYLAQAQQSPAAEFRWMRVEDHDELQKAREILKALGVCKHGNALHEADCGCGV